jgi:hypothetical protein
MSSTQEVPQAAPGEEKKEEEVKGKDIASALASFPEAPTKEDIEGYKQKFGEVFCSGFSDQELYVWRPLSRKEFVELQSELSQAQGTQLDQEQRVAQLCLLWASDEAKRSLEQKAGSLSTLHEQVMFNSNFVDPRIASALVVKL